MTSPRSNGGGGACGLGDALGTARILRCRSHFRVAPRERAGALRRRYFVFFFSTPTRLLIARSNNGTVSSTTARPVRNLRASWYSEYSPALAPWRLTNR